MAAKFASADGDGGAQSAACPDPVRELFHGLAKNIPGLLLEDKKLRPGAALSAGAGSAPGPDLGDGKACRSVRGRKGTHSAWQGGDRSQARWAWTRALRVRGPGEAKAISPAAPSCSAATTPPIWMCFASCPIWAGAAFRWAAISRRGHVFESPARRAPVADPDWPKRVMAHDAATARSCGGRQWPHRRPGGYPAAGWSGGVFPASTAIRFSAA